VRLDLSQLATVVLMAQTHLDVSAPDEVEELAVKHVSAWLDHKDRLAARRRAARNKCPNCGLRARGHSCTDTAAP